MPKKLFQLVILFCLNAVASWSQGIGGADPDSLMAEWLEAGEWEGVSLHPDIAMDWLAEMDSLPGDAREKLLSRIQMLTMNIPPGACVIDWKSDSGDIVSPVSMRYRVKIAEPRRWEFRLQMNQNAGDSCLFLPETGVPRRMSSGFLVRPGGILSEVIIGDFQVNSGFGVVAGSSPVFSVSLGNPGSLHRIGKGIRLHSGTGEGRFFRGIAVALGWGKSEALAYASGRDGINEEVAGFGWKRSFSTSEIGFSGIRLNNQFPAKIKEGWTAVWQPDSGRCNRLGVWGQTRLPFGILFGEAGFSPGGGYGWIAGVRWFEAHGFSAVLRYNGCTPGYPVTYSQFQSGTGLTREGQRVIVSFRYAPLRIIEWLGSAEINLSQWPGSNTHFNNASTRISQQIKYISKNFWTSAGTLQFDFLESGSSMPQKLTWKLAFDSDPKQSGTLRFRAGFRQQLQGFGEILAKGTTADYSVSAFLAERKLRIVTGFRVFTVEAGTDPLYAYEPDVLYGWSAPVLSGSGIRWFITIRYKILTSIDLEIKFGQTAYSDLKHLSDTNAKGSSGKIQVSWRTQR